MVTYLKTRKALAVAVVAIVLGFISAKWLPQGNPLVTAPWGVVAFLIAFIAVSKREALILGGVLGFVASYSYLWFDNTDSPSLGKILFLIVLIIIPALFGLLSGALCSWLGWFVRKFTQRKS